MALRGIRGNTNHADAFGFRFVNQRSQILWVSRGENNPVDATLHEVLEYRRVAFSQDLNGPILKLDTQLPYVAGFLEDPAPKLVIEKMNFAGDANANASAAFRNRKRTRGEVGSVANLAGNLQNMLARGFLEIWDPTKASPALLINTTEPFTGRRRIIAPFVFPSGQEQAETDLRFLPISKENDLPLSTANSRRDWAFSTRPCSLSGP